MEVKNLHFFDKSGYELNFDWIEIKDKQNNDKGYWEGNIYLPKVSVGLYSNTSIYVLENVDGNYVFPKSNNNSTIMFSWDILNKFVDEFFMFTFDTSYIQEETSSLTYTENDGPDCKPILITRFDTYEINLESENISKAIPIHVAFTSPEKYNSNTFKRTLVMEYNFRQIARINFFAETVEEDERLKILNYNLGYNISKNDEFIFKKSDIKEPKPDYQLLNEKRKELLINGHNIYPHIGSYKALINALKFFGYDNLNIIDIWKNVNENDENYGKQYYVKKYTLTENEVIYCNNHKIKLPSSNFRKLPNIALSYYINTPKKENGNYLYDVFELPYTEEHFDYTLEDALIKLFALRDKLNKDFLPGRSRIIDIVGEANYFGLCGIKHHSKLGSTTLYNNGKNLSISSYPNNEIRLTTNKQFNEYIFKKEIENWNSDVKNLSSIIENIYDSNLNSIDFYNNNEIDLLSQKELCEYYKDFYKDLNENFTIEDDILDDLHDYFDYFESTYFYYDYYSPLKPDFFDSDSDSDSDSDFFDSDFFDSDSNFFDSDSDLYLLYSKYNLQSFNSLFNSIISEKSNSETSEKKYRTLFENEISDKSSLEKVIIHNRCKVIPSKSFSDCGELTNVSIEYGVFEIDSYAFSNCNKLEEVIIPNSITKINRYAFSNCPNLKSIKFAGSKNEWNKITKHSTWNYNSENIIITYNYNIERNNIISAKVILTNESLPVKTFDELSLTFGNISNYITFENINYYEYNEIEWTVEYSENQDDEDLSNVGISKTFDNHAFTETKKGLLTEYNSCLFELPYTGYYDVMIKLTDRFNNINSKIYKKYIKVEPYNIDIRGFYYDAREIPNSLISNEYYRNMLFNDDYSYDSDDSDDDISMGDTSDDAFYYEMKLFITDRLKSMMGAGIPENASATGNTSTIMYKNNYDSLYCNVYEDSYSNIIKLDRIYYDSNNELHTINLYNKSNSSNISKSYKKYYIKFYDSSNNKKYRIYTNVSINNTSNNFDLSSSVTYTYIEFENDKIVTDGKIFKTTNINPIIDNNVEIQYIKNGNFNSIDIVNNGPYLLDNIFNEWQQMDNVNLDITLLKPLIKNVRYIKNGVDIKPYTWIMIGYDYSLIRGKCNPKWTLINTTLNKRYPNWDYKNISEYKYLTYEEKAEQLPTHIGKYFTYLLKDEGNYKIILELDDINGNHYSIERNLFVVSSDANYKLYTPFLNDYQDYIDTKNLKELKAYNDTLIDN